MPRRLAILSPVSVVALVTILAAGCGDDPAPEPSPGPSTGGSSTAAADDRCAAVSGADLTAWTGEPFEVSDDGDDGCQSVGEVENRLRVSWTFEVSSASLQEDADSRSGLDAAATPVRVGGVEAFAATGSPGGEPQAVVVAPVAGGTEAEIVVVRVVNNAGRDAVEESVLVDVATQVASAYVG